MTPALEAIMLVLGSLGLVWISRAALQHRHSHGLYRLLAWEVILIAIVLNLEVWFRDPFSPHQIVSWILLSVSLWPVLHGVVALRRHGSPEMNREDPSLVGLEKTTKLVTTGPYRYIRHPLCSSLLLLAWGVFCKRPSWVGSALAVLATLFLALTAHVEEEENVQFFGPSYATYMRHTKRFIPFLF